MGNSFGITETSVRSLLAAISMYTVEAVNLAAAEQNLPPVQSALKLYCARHTFATDMLAEGMNLAQVKDLMGHTDVKTTMKYLHPDTSGAADVVNQRNREKFLHLLKAAS